MKINICPELWEKYLGKWNFSIFLDYCLEIKRNRKSISIDIFDILTWLNEDMKILNELFDEFKNIEENKKEIIKKLADLTLNKDN